LVIESHGVLVYRRGRLVAWSPLFETAAEAEVWAAPWRGRGRFEVLVDAGPGSPEPRARREVIEPGASDPRR